MATKIQVRRDTTAGWAAEPLAELADGEFGLDTTTGTLKIGPGLWVDCQVVSNEDVLPDVSNLQTLIQALTVRVAQLEADHTAAMGNMGNNNSGGY